MKESCKICGKGPFSRLDLHLRQSHNLTREEYDTQSPEDDTQNLEDDTFEELEDNETVPETKPSTQQDRTSEIFKGAKHEYPRDLDGFLEHFKITESDLLSLVQRFTEGKSINVTKSIQNSMNSAEVQAKKLVEEQGDKITTNSLYAAEILEKKFGYRCTKVTSNPKKWVLQKA